MIRLASSSQTRAKLLRDAGIEFVQQSADFDEESIRANSAREFVYRATLGKYEAAYRAYGIEDMPLLVADTVVAKGEMILRKPRDKEDAKSILKMLSGSEIAIITCMIYHKKSCKLIDLSATHYKFDFFDEVLLDEYLSSMQWQGKAGACMVEGWCKRFIKHQKGYESTAMGLSVEVLQKMC